MNRTCIFYLCCVVVVVVVVFISYVEAGSVFMTSVKNTVKVGVLNKRKEHYTTIT